MTPERWRQVEELFHAAQGRAPAERAAFLDAACGGDEGLRREIESLIAAHERDGSFLDSPAYEGAAGPGAEGSAPALAGRKIGHYEVVSALGAGGMGEVYLARDARLGRKVALKLLPARLAQDQDRLRRFKQEARAASALNHPNILTIHEIGEWEGRHYIATEYVEGETLRERVARGRMSAGEVLDVGVQMASALAAAHEAGIVHRDVKPENVMLRRDGYVKVLDFGLAKLAEPKGADAEASTRINTEAGVVMGTAHYMSPEQARGLAVDGRTDVFSLGVVLYEMLAGARPFDGETASDVIVSLLEREPPPLAGRAPEAPAELVRVVGRCLEKKRELRYQSAQELLGYLKKLQRDISTGAITAEVTRKHRWYKRPAAGRLLIASAAALLLAAALAYALLLRRAPGDAPSPEAPPAIKSLAVLPLENLTGDPNQEYFADGMTDVLIADLSKISALRVISRTSVMQYKGARKPLPEIARELNVDGVVEGSVQRSGDEVLVTVQLIHAPTDRHLWAENYRRSLRDVLALQSEVAQAITGQIKVTLTPQERQRVAASRQVDPEAQEVYFKGLYYFNKLAPTESPKALDYFQQAVKEDPNYALAYAGIANTYMFIGNSGTMPTTEAYPKAKEAALKAQEIDDTLPETHAALAYVKDVYDRDPAGAEAEYRRAAELNPSYALVHNMFSEFLMRMGRSDEAMQEARRAMELEPLSLNPQVLVGEVYHYARQYDRAIEQYRKVQQLDPNYEFACWFLQQAYISAARYDEATAETRRCLSIDPDYPPHVALLGYEDAKQGKRDEAIKVLNDLREKSKSSFVRPYSVAQLYCGLGENDRAIEWLERAYDEHDDWLSWAKIDPLLDPLRPDPRFRDLLRRVHLET